MNILCDLTPDEFIEFGKIYDVDFQFLDKYYSPFDIETRRFTSIKNKNTIDRITTAQHIGWNHIEFLKKNKGNVIGIYAHENQIIVDGDIMRMVIMKGGQKPISIRETIFKKIDEERAYQDLKWSTGQRSDQVPDKDKSVAEWLNYIEYHLDIAKKNVYQLDKTAALDEIRKVTALAVACMEIHGCPERKPIVKSEVVNKTTDTFGESMFKRISRIPICDKFQTKTYQEWLNNCCSSYIIKD